jgi:hypothetical protein
MILIKLNCAMHGKLCMVLFIRHTKVRLPRDNATPFPIYGIMEDAGNIY